MLAFLLPRILVPASCGNFAENKTLAIFIPYSIAYLKQNDCNLLVWYTGNACSW